jgi:hypothetical protein
MVTMFQLLKAQQARQPGRVAQFFSDHPNPDNREARVRQEAQLLRARGSVTVVGGLEDVKAQLRRMPPAGTMSQIARAAQSGQGSSYPSAGSAGTGAVARIEQPSSRMRSFRQRNDFFQIQYPDNWRVSEPASGYGVTILPPGGAVRASNGEDVLVYGVVINHYEPFEGSIGNVWGSRTGPASGRGTLDQATNDLVNELTRANPYLRVVSGTVKRQTLDNANALSLVLAGRSPMTGADERVTVFTRELPDGHVLYALFVAPAQDYTALSRTFQSMVASLHVNERSAHQEHAH